MQCPKCEKETNHTHKHSCAHGLSGTHMAGSENYECKECGHTLYKTDGEAQGLRYVLD